MIGLAAWADTADARVPIVVKRDAAGPYDLSGDDGTGSAVGIVADSRPGQGAPGTASR